MQIDQGIALIDKPAGGVAVFDRHLGARESIIRRRHLHKRNRFLVTRPPQITDFDVEQVLGAGREIKAKHDNQGEHCKADQGGVPD